MKAIEHLTNTEKAKLLYDLFPTEIPIFLNHLENACNNFRENKEQYAKEWDSGFIGFDYWFSLAEETAGILKRHKFNMARSCKVFSDQLFYTYTCLFVNDWIIKFAEQESQNKKFKIAVELIFK